MPHIFLDVPFVEKDAAKALGARWNPSARKWYIATGTDLAPFSAWLPANASISSSINTPNNNQYELAEPTASYAPSTTFTAASPPAKLAGVSLSNLLQQVQASVARSFITGVWTLVELLSVQIKNGHVYLEVAERTPQGEVLATARGMIWANVAAKILPEFERLTGVSLAQGIKLLVNAKPNFHPRFGLSLEISAINADYTLGDLEAKKKEIRLRLQQEGIFTANKSLPPVWNFNQVLVISPEQAAGLGDFKAEAQQLEKLNLCRFFYATSRFQGEAAASEIAASLNAALAKLAQQNIQPDAVVIIRGGGAVNDLAWLNDYQLAKALCVLPLPVLTGIGHEKDSTVLDEIAHQSYDTPSKVIAGIKQSIINRALEVKDNFNLIHRLAKQSLSQQQHQLEQLYTFISSASQQEVNLAKQHSQQLIQLITAAAQGQVSSARQLTFKLNEEVSYLAQQQITSTRQAVKQQFSQISHEAKRSLETAKTASEALFREIVSQGPEKTLTRGFALVRNQQGKPITQLADVEPNSQISVQLSQGEFKARVEH